MSPPPPSMDALSGSPAVSMVDHGATAAYHVDHVTSKGVERTCAVIRRLAMAGGDKITVLNPMGYPPTVTHKPLAPRLETLDGKTVYLVDCRFDDADIFLKQVQAW